jgi:hypothetical protein
MSRLFGNGVSASPTKRFKQKSLLHSKQINNHTDSQAQISKQINNHTDSQAQISASFSEPKTTLLNARKERTNICIKLFKRKFFWSLQMAGNEGKSFHILTCNFFQQLFLRYMELFQSLANLLLPQRYKLINRIVVTRKHEIQRLVQSSRVIRCPDGKCCNILLLHKDSCMLKAE